MIRGAAKHATHGTADGTEDEISVQSVVLKTCVLLNTTAAVAYFQVFNKKAADVTPGTTVPKWSIGLPASAGLSLPLGDGVDMGGDGLTVIGTTTIGGSTGAAIVYNLAWD